MKLIHLILMVVMTISVLMGSVRAFPDPLALADPVAEALADPAAEALADPAAEALADPAAEALADPAPEALADPNPLALAGLVPKRRKDCPCYTIFGPCPFICS
ncbi:delta-myrmicitoxin-Mri1a-like [Cherax quadricarinatus]|uniref:delta-myrmicitoxin-Mri1a-like n=1 Tax=Cherax quadricarinatus TaxID=27406 RepID=UPI0023784B49|nr:coiled-coil domain-containing protein 8-like [Cherax quadricarinatus]